MNLSEADIRQIMVQEKICVVVPTYNNGGTIRQVLERIMPFCDSIIVVNDGCTDGTHDILVSLSDRISIIEYGANRGKGYALRRGFEEAERQGFEYAITIDSDGQHYPEDLPLFIAAFQQNKGALIVGSRNLKMENMPGKNTFANRFSNFWFHIQTGIELPDTQTGYRLYPLEKLPNLKLLTSRYEAELELLVGSAWRGTDLVPIKINVFYPKAEERVTHFRPFWDFFRISVLNTVLCILALLYGWPSRLIRKWRRHG